MATVIECPKCKCQLEVKLSFASSPKKATLSVRSNGNNIGAMLDEAQTKDLNPWEQEFIETLQSRYDEYGERVKLSDKQLGTLQNIAGK